MRRTSLLLFLTLAATLFATDKPALLPDAASQQARNKAVAARVFEEIFNQGKFQVADEIYASDFVNHGLHKTFDLQADQAAVHAEKKAFPDLKITVDRMVAEGDLVTVVWTFREQIPPPDMDSRRREPQSNCVASRSGELSTEKFARSGHHLTTCKPPANS